MGEGEDERPPNFDEILEMTGLDPDQVSMSHIWELSFLFIYLPRSSVLHSFMLSQLHYIYQTNPSADVI